MTDFNFFNYLKDNAKHHPKEIAVFGKSTPFTYQSIYERALEINSLLKDIPKGEGVILFLPNDPSFIAGLFGVIKSNHVILPVDYQQQRNALHQIMAESQINYVISLSSEKLDFLSCHQEVNNIALFRGEIKPQNIGSLFENAAFIRFTSGTTGKSKGVVINHKAIKARTEYAQSALNFEPGKKMLWLLPMAYHFVVSICLYIRYRIPIVIQESFLPEEILNTLLNDEIAYVYASPIHVKTLGNMQKKVALPNLEKFISTTAGLDHSAAQKFHKTYSIPVTQAFGIIEVGLPLINNIDAQSHPDAVGTPVKGNIVQLFNEDHKVSKTNEGLLGIKKNDGMFSGYLTPFNRIDEVLVNGYFMTGDIASHDEKGSYSIKGRAKNVILVAGNKVFPAEIESVVNQIEGIDESMAYGQTHPIFGQTITVNFVSQQPHFDIEKLRSKVQGKLLQHQWPHEYQQVNFINKTDTGKIKRG